MKYKLFTKLITSMTLFMACNSLFAAGGYLQSTQTLLLKNILDTTTNTKFSANFQLISTSPFYVFELVSTGPANNTYPITTFDGYNVLMPDLSHAGNFWLAFGAMTGPTELTILGMEPSDVTNLGCEEVGEGNCLSWPAQEISGVDCFFSFTWCSLE